MKTRVNQDEEKLVDRNLAQNESVKRIRSTPEKEAPISKRPRVNHYGSKHNNSMKSKISTSPRWFRKGDAVWVFCCEDRDYTNKWHACFFAVQDESHGMFRPRLGISEGWLPAVVVRDFDPSLFREHEIDSGVHCEYICSFYNCRGYNAKKEKSELWTRVQPFRVVPRSTEPRHSIERNMRMDSWEPTLNLLVFRWGGKNIPSNDYEILGVNNEYFYMLQDCGLKALLRTNYEVWSIFVEDEEDCKKLADAFHLIFPKHHAARRGKNVAALFFLQPTEFDPKSTANTQTGSDGGAGNIGQAHLFQLMCAVERAGIPVRFPHTANLYRLLTDKSWTHTLCLDTSLCIPATVAVPRELISVDISRGSAQVLRALNTVKRKQYKRAGLRVAPAIINKGVAKLGFSWEGVDVKLWDEKDTKVGSSGNSIQPKEQLRGTQKFIEAAKYNHVGRYGLKDALQDLSKQCNYTGRLIVQEFVPHVVEMRLYYLENKFYSMVFTKFPQVKRNHEFGGFYHMSRQNALKLMGNDEKALNVVVAEGKRISLSLLDWVMMETCEEIISGIRFDFLINYLPHNNRSIDSFTGPGRGHRRLNGAHGIVEVSTLEICELGFACFDNEKLREACMPAIVQSCLR